MDFYHSFLRGDPPKLALCSGFYSQKEPYQQMGFAAQDRGLRIALFITQHSLVPSCVSQLRPDRGFSITQISPLGPQNRPETYCYRISIRRLSKSILFKRNLKENRWFFDPRPLPTRPGSQNRYFLKGISKKIEGFSIPSLSFASVLLRNIYLETSKYISDPPATVVSPPRAIGFFIDPPNYIKL